MLSNNAVAAVEAVWCILCCILSLSCLSNPSVVIKLKGQLVNSLGMNNVERFESNNFHTQAIYTGLLACRMCVPYKAKRLWREHRLRCVVIYISGVCNTRSAPGLPVRFMRRLSDLIRIMECAPTQSLRIL